MFYSLFNSLKMYEMSTEFQLKQKKKKKKNILNKKKKILNKKKIFLSFFK